MKTSAKVTVQDGVFKVNFDVFEAVWGYLLYDNISLLADSNSNNLKLYSFLSGKEQTSADISKDNIEELSKSQIIEISYALGDNQTAVFKKETIDVTGKFVEAIEAQFKGRNATAIECYKAVLEANPNNYRAFGLLGRCFRSEGKNDEADGDCGAFRHFGDYFPHDLIFFFTENWKKRVNVHISCKRRWNFVVYWQS